jgi:hypothetical protein
MGSAAAPEKAAALKGKEKKVRELMLGSGKSAENFQPRGRLNSKLEVLEYFNLAHEKLIKLFDSIQDLDSHIYGHPAERYGDLTVRQWFYYIAYHKQRHVEQIAAVKANADYPGRVRKTSLEAPAEARIAQAAE